MELGHGGAQVPDLHTCLRVKILHLDGNTSVPVGQPPFKLNVDVTCGAVIFANWMPKILHQIGAALYTLEAVIIDTTLETDLNTNVIAGHSRNTVLEFLSMHQQLKDH